MDRVAGSGFNNVVWSSPRFALVCSLHSPAHVGSVGPEYGEHGIRLQPSQEDPCLYSGGGEGFHCQVSSTSM